MIGLKKHYLIKRINESICLLFIIIQVILNIPFIRYAREAVSALGIVFQDSELENETITKMLSDWWNVVVFYSLRLLMATVIETGILLDRSLHLNEKGDRCFIK